MDTEHPEHVEPDPRSLAVEVLQALAISIAFGVGAALGPELVRRGAIWIDRALAALEEHGTRHADAIRAQWRIDREARKGAGAVVWEAMEIAEAAADGADTERGSDDG